MYRYAITCLLCSLDCQTFAVVKKRKDVADCVCVGVDDKVNKFSLLDIQVVAKV